MRAANEVAEMNTLRRTHVVTDSATRAFVVIYGGKIVVEGDGTVRTLLCTEAATDASVLTNLTNLGTLVVVVTLDNYTLGVLDKMNDSVGALLCTKAATDTLLRVDDGDALFGVNADSVSRANLHTVAVAKACKGTFSVAGEEHICSCAGSGTGVRIFSLLGTARAVAGYVSNHFNNVLRLNAHNGRNIASDTVATGHAERSLVGYTLGKRLRISVTAGKAAGAAVCAGQTVADSESLLILLDGEEHRGKSEDDGAKQSDSRQNEYGN